MPPQAAQTPWSVAGKPAPGRGTLHQGAWVWLLQARPLLHLLSCVCHQLGAGQRLGGSEAKGRARTPHRAPLACYRRHAMRATCQICRKRHPTTKSLQAQAPPPWPRDRPVSCLGSPRAPHTPVEGAAHQPQPASSKTDGASAHHCRWSYQRRLLCSLHPLGGEATHAPHRMRKQHQQHYHRGCPH